MTPPSEITNSGLKELPETRLGYVATRSLRDALFDLRGKVPSDRLWLAAVGRTYFRNFQLYDEESPAYFSLDEDTVRRIKEANPDLENARFHTVRAEGQRPFLVMNSCIVGPSSLAPFSMEELVHFEYSPLAIGSPHPLAVEFTSRKKEKGHARREVGGGLIEPFAFGGDSSPEAPSGCQPPEPPASCTLAGLPPPPRPFSLADAAGTSSSAAAADLDRIGLTDRLGAQATYWPVSTAAAPPAEQFDFGDGGSLENYGLITLLLRKVERLVVFINTSTKLRLGYDPARPPTGKDLDGNLPPLFGFPMGVTKHNQVFPQDDLAPLVRTLQTAKRDGNTAMAATRHEVQANDWWGVQGGWTVRILWFYLDRVKSWESQLPRGIRRSIELGNEPIVAAGPYRYFPNYKTIDENLLELVELTRRQVNLLADLTCWNLTENRQAIDDFLSGP